MKKISLLFVAFLVGCSTTINNNSFLLKDYYLEYKSFTGTPREKGFVKDELWATLVSAREKANKSAFVNSLASFPTEMTQHTDFKEQVANNSGCLLVSGVNSKKIPMDYYLTFEQNDEKWIISDITVKYFFDGAERFLKEAECNEEKRMHLWLEYIQSKD